MRLNSPGAWIDIVQVIAATLAALALVAFALAGRADGADLRVRGIGGNAYANVFSMSSARRPIPAGWQGLRFNLTNYSTNTYNVTIKIGGRLISEYVIGQGVTAIREPDFRGETPVSFEWNAVPNQVILSVPDSGEYSLFKWALVALGLASLSSLVYAIYYRRRPAILSVFALLGTLYFFAFVENPIPLGGDEPHYLVMAQSLAHDFDLSLENDYGRDLRRIYHADPPGPHTQPGSDRAAHFPLLAILLAPPFVLERLGLQINLLFAAKTIALLFMAWAVALILHRLRRVSTFAFAGLAFLGAPWIMYTGQLYPEVIAAPLLLIACFSKSRVSRYVVISLLPLLHIKFALCSLVFTAAQIHRDRRSIPSVVAGLLSFALPLPILVSLGYFSVYSADSFSIVSVPGRYLVYLFDVDRGLLATNPLLFLALFALPLALKHKTNRLALIILFAAHLPNLFYSDWLPGNCPAGRYWIAVYPLIVLFSLRGLEACNNLWHTSPRAAIKVAIVIAGFLCLCISIANGYLAWFRRDLLYLPLQDTYRVLAYFSIDLRFLFWSAGQGGLAIFGWVVFALALPGLGFLYLRSRAQSPKRPRD